MDLTLSSDEDPVTPPPSQSQKLDVMEIEPQSASPINPPSISQSQQHTTMTAAQASQSDQQTFYFTKNELQKSE